MKNTLLTDIYNVFFSKVTDDMYLELTQAETESMAFNLFTNALPHFEFPRVDLYAYNEETMEYPFALSNEEQNIIAIYMAVEWFGQQIASIELTRLMYSSSDFKFTSQANHLTKLIKAKEDYERQGFHLQRLYKRRIKDANGIYKSTFSSIMNSNQ